MATGVNAFCNLDSDVADDALDGLITARGGTIWRLPRVDQTRVVVRCDLDHSCVSVISGGGAGHEPLHAGLVGKGLLDGAVSGGVFASPSANAVLAAIESVALPGGPGCLLVVKNYTGDTLNFSLAAARARVKGIAVRQVVVRDDAALDAAKRARGIAGTALVHRVAAWHAERGCTLQEVAAVAQRASDALVSVGVARTSCTVPGAGVEATNKERIIRGTVEVGIGIHGEPGRETCELSGSKVIIDKLCAILSNRVYSARRYACLFNNLGGLSELECLVLFNDLTKNELFKTVDYFMGPCGLVTSLDMAGFSITFMQLDDEFKQPLLDPCSVPAWPGFVRVVPTPDEGALPERDVAPKPSSNTFVGDAIDRAKSRCAAMNSQLNSLDAAGGDGDTGLTLLRASDSLDIDSLPLNEPALLCARIGETIGNSGGTLGGIVGLLLAETSSRLPADATWESDGISTTWGCALHEALKVVCDALGSKPGDRSIIDALAPAIQALQSGGTLAEAAARAREGCQSTASMKAAVGRAANVPADALQGTMDPGARAAAEIIDALAST